MKIASMSRSICLLVMATFIISGCVYYNTFYLARKNFNQAESSRRKENRDKAAGGEITAYTTAIKKASKVLSEHPNSNWVDDALFVIGKSFYYLGDFAKAERKFRELLSNFPDSKYAEESRFFLGKSRYQLENYILAKEVFDEFLQSSKNNEWRSEALYLLAEMSAKQEDDSTAIAYYQRFVTEFRSNFRTPELYFKIGDLQYKTKAYAEAVESYARAAATSQEDKPRYDARYHQGMALYMIDSVNAGLALFEKLKSEQKDSVYLGNLLLRIAEGKNLMGEERDAILLYDDVATNFVHRIESAEAYYHLGEIAQHAWGDLVVAKDMYLLASMEQRGGDWRTLASEKVADIKKVETYLAEMSSDSTNAETAAQNRFLLAEMYRTDLNRPDSAMQEYKTLVATNPESDLAPRALLAIGWILESHYNDTAAAHTFYQQVVDKYPRSDALQKAVELLDLSGAEPYELSPDKLYSMAENQLFDDQNLDSATVLFKRVVEEFPKSRYVPKAEFAIAKIELQRFVPATKPRPRPKIETITPDSSAEVKDSTITADSMKLPIVIDTLSAAEPDTNSMQTAKDSTHMNPILDSTKVSLASDTTRKAAALANNATTPIAGDTTKRPVVSDSGKIAAKPDSSKADSTGGIVRLADLIGRKDGQPIDTTAAAAKRDSLLAARNLKNGQKVPTPTKDSVKVITAQDSARVTVVEDSAKTAGHSADSLAVKPETADTVYVDSTMIYVFKALAEKYAGTDVGDEALRLATGGAEANSRAKQQQALEQQQRQRQAAEAADTVGKGDTTKTVTVDTLTVSQQAEQVLKEEIEKWPLMDDEPSIKGEFTYPVEASTSKFEGRLTLKIRIEFDGKVAEVVFLKGSDIPAINQQVEKALLDTYFDTLKIEPLKLNGKYFIYYYEVKLPEVYR